MRTVIGITAAILVRGLCNGFLEDLMTGPMIARLGTMVVEVICKENRYMMYLNMQWQVSGMEIYYKAQGH